MATNEYGSGQMSTDIRGFTLIELLIVVVIIGVLSSIAIPQVGLVRDRAIIGSMKSDLRNLMSAQEAYFTDQQAYASDLSALGDLVRTSENVTLAIQNASSSGWEATATHPGVNELCRIGISSGVARSPYCEDP